MQLAQTLIERLQEAGLVSGSRGLTRNPPTSLHPSSRCGWSKDGWSGHVAGPAIFLAEFPSVKLVTNLPFWHPIPRTDGCQACDG
jgi:hypothetical protein